MTGPERILLAHGSGGRLTHALVRDVFLPSFSNAMLATLSDSAVLPELPPGRAAMTTDAFVVDPPVFPGGDLGYLAVCGTVNDLAVAGARPLWLSFAMILEEGCPGTLLETIAMGAANAAREAGIEIVAGDTKVVPKGKGDLAYAVTSGLGVIPPGREFGDHRIAAGDAILASGSIGDHGATIMACRHKMAGPRLRSDCAPLSSLVSSVVDAGVDVHAMHDPTRGGLAAVCNEVAGRVGLRMMLEEAAVPVRPEVGAICELLGLDPLYVACEGRAILWVASRDAERALQILRAHPQGRDAARIGTVSATKAGTAPVLLRTRIGGERPVDLLSGMDLPRIC